MKPFFLFLALTVIVTALIAGPIGYFATKQQQEGRFECGDPEACA